MAELKMEREAIFCENPPFPKNMLIELTNVCNHRCVFCAYDKMRRKHGNCDKMFIFDIMKQAYDAGTREIGFYMIGEPLLCKNFEEYIAEAKKIGFTYIYLTTNGALANIERMKVLLKAGLNSVKFSINAGTEKTYKKIHGKDDYQVVKKNVYDLSEYIREYNINVPLFISYIENEWNKDEITIFKQQFENYVDKIYVFPCKNQGGGMLELLEKGIVKDDLKSGSVLPCSMIFNRLHITYEGYLSACCADINNYMAIIDLHDISLEEAWNSEMMVDLRRQHMSGKLSKIACYNCIYNTDINIMPINSKLAY